MQRPTQGRRRGGIERMERVRVLPDTPMAQDDTLSVDDRDQLERETLDIPLGTAKSRLHYATASLSAAIDANARTSPSDSTGERSA